MGEVGWDKWVGVWWATWFGLSGLRLAWLG